MDRNKTPTDAGFMAKGRINWVSTPDRNCPPRRQQCVFQRQIVASAAVGMV